MFKKNLWIVGLVGILTALTMAFIGCVDPYVDAGGADDIEQTLFTLSDVIKDIPDGDYSSNDLFNAVFNGTPLSKCGNPKYEIKTVDGKKVFVTSNMTATWGEGFDLYSDNNDSTFGLAFRSGDTIRVKGTADADKKFVLAISNQAQISSWNAMDDGAGVFDKTFTISSAEAGTISSNGLANGKNVIRFHFIDGGAGRQGTITIEEIVVVGRRAPDFLGEGGSGGGLGGYVKPSGGTDSSGQTYFYVNANKPEAVVFKADGNSFIKSVGEPPVLKEEELATVAIEFPISNVTGSTNQRPTMGFKLSAAEVDAILSGSTVDIELIASDDSTTATYRFAMGSLNGEPGGAWNSTYVWGPHNVANTLTTYNGSFSWEGDKKDKGRVEYLIVQKIGGVDVASVLTIKSIKLTVLLPLVISNFSIDIDAPVAGHKPTTEINHAQLAGKITWSPTPVSEITLDGGKKLPGPRFEKNTTYTATVALEPKAGFSLDGWPNGTPFIITTSNNNNTTANANKTYSVITKRLTGIAFDVTGATYELTHLDGVFDSDLNDTYAKDANYVKTVYSLTSATSGAGYAGAGATPTFLEGGINVVRDSTTQGWQGLDTIDLTATALGITPVTRKYKVTVYGYLIGTAANASMSLDGHDGVSTPISTYPGAFATVTGISGANQSFKLSGELPATWFTGVGDGTNTGDKAPQKKVRINSPGSDTGGISTFRVTLIEIEDIGAR